MAEITVVRTPWRQRWRRFRYQLFPVICFILAMGVVIRLWGEHAGLHGAIGEVEAVRQFVTAPADGIIVRPADKAWELFEQVKKGDVLVCLDDRATVAALATIHKTVIQLGKELEATKARERQLLAEAGLDQSDREYGCVNDERQMARDIEQLRLDILDRKRRIARDQVEQRRFSEETQALRELRRTGAASDFEVFDMEMQAARMQEEVKGRQQALAKAEEQLKALQAARGAVLKRMKDFPKPELAELETLLAPVRAAIDVEEARMTELEVEQANLAVRAKFDGMIREILCEPGQAVRMGDPILTIVSPQATHVITYVREHQRISPRKGVEVKIRVRTLPTRTVTGHICDIGVQVVRVPLQHQLDPRMVEWGLPVRIEIDPSARLRPGELVDLTFPRSH